MSKRLTPPQQTRSSATAGPHDAFSVAKGKMLEKTQQRNLATTETYLGGTLWGANPQAPPEQGRVEMRSLGRAAFFVISSCNDADKDKIDHFFPRKLNSPCFSDAALPSKNVTTRSPRVGPGGPCGD